MKLLLNLLKGLSLKGAGKLIPFGGVAYGLAIAALKLSGQDGAATALEQVGPIVGLETPFPLGVLTVFLTTGYGIMKFLGSAIKRAQVERPIDQVVPRLPDGGRDYFFELLHVLQHDQGLPLDKAFRRSRELLADAERAGISPAAVVAHLRENKA